MYAIFESGGNQHRVAVGDRVRVDQLKAEPNSTMTFDNVLLIGGENAKVGTPLVDGAKVEAKVIEHGLGPKLVAYKYEQRNHARRKQGFRWHYTELEVTGIQGA